MHQPFTLQVLEMVKAYSFSCIAKWMFLDPEHLDFIYNVRTFLSCKFLPWAEIGQSREMG